ncbi:hypothetical protein Forpe1208_v006959 [Fusarium oxysporum f. sp. rapae]|uniref:Uncharacterized protein n=1 Tax=Fusarium oxysporum f. sp. rapae TaxID=485398 RepID=A0A8J5TUX6_FUSOX|nr:hypothetical protein Forpe1208_v006959 [Fusarium oxysporum f. sp. rapae]
MEQLTGVHKESDPKDLELLAFCPATIERSFSVLRPFDYKERYSLHYILLRKYSGDENMTHAEADREANIHLDEYKTEHFERLCEESREWTEWQEQEKVRDCKYWREKEYDRRAYTVGYDESEENGSEDHRSEGDESEGDGASSWTGMYIDLPEPTDKDLTTQISVLHIASKK